MAKGTASAVPFALLAATRSEPLISSHRPIRPWGNTVTYNRPLDEPKRHRALPWIIGAAVLVIILLVLGCVGIFAAPDETPEAPIPTSASSGPTPPTEDPTPPRKGNPSSDGEAGRAPQQMGDGTWIVGEEMEAGVYRTPGAEDRGFVFCSWNVRGSEKSDADYLDGGTSDKTEDPQRAVLKKGNRFETSGCGVWKKQ